MRILLVALSLVIFCGPVAGQELARRAFLGVMVAPLDESQQALTDHGLTIQRVFDNSTASRFGFQEGEVILSVNDVELRGVGELPRALRDFRSGDTVEFEILGADGVSNREVTLQQFPPEQYEAAEIVYDAVQTVNGLQRSILTVPENVPTPPVVYILQGFDCSSIDVALSPPNSTALLIERLNSIGMATYRLEKSGRGDSMGRRCEEIGFEDESSGFMAGLDALKNNTSIDPDRVFLLGISLGGIWAPMLAAESEVAGIVSFGTIAKTWPEYMYDNWRRQWELAGRSYTDMDSDLKLASQFWHLLISEDNSPAQIFSQQPQLNEIADSVAWVEQYNSLFGRHYSFVAELARINIMALWQQVEAPTLVLWGRGDYIAGEEEQQLIHRALQQRNVDASIEYVDSDHYWRESEDFYTSYINLREGTPTPFQEQVFAKILDWLEPRVS